MPNVKLVAVPEGSPVLLAQGSMTPGAFTLPTGRFAVVAEEVELVGAEEAVLEGTSVLVIL